MSRSTTPIVCLFALAGALAAGGSIHAADPEVQALAQKVEALEKKLAAMEQRLNQQLRSIELRLSQGAQANSQLESQAQAALGRVNQLVVAGEMGKAKAGIDEFMKQYGSTNTARQARRVHQELAVIGKEAPANWGIEKWFQGEGNVDLSSKQTTLLVFWETWCPHCQREVPKLQELYTDLKGEGLQVVGLTKITKSATEEKVYAFIKQRGVEYPVAKENGSLSQHFNVSGIPAAAVVKDGKIIWRGHPARLSRDQLKKWL